MRRITGAILRVTVPAMIMRSACRGEARKTPAPKRSMSYRDDTVAIISIAQQARPNVIGNSADFRDQFTSASRLVLKIFASNCRSRRLICSTPPLPEGDCRDALHCARRTSTFLSCAFREQEDDQAALPILPRPRAARARSPSCTPLESVPFERSLLPGIPESDEQDEKKDDHFYKPQQAE